MKKWSFWLGIYSIICMFGGCVSVIIDAPISTYILASFGMLFSILAWYVAKRERDAARKRLVFSPIVPSATEIEWIRSMNEYHGIPPITLQMLEEMEGPRNGFKMPEEWDALVEELRKP